jgi:Na+/melibiose symporter-like transporter
MDLQLKAQLTADDYAEAQRLHSGFRVHLILGTIIVLMTVLAICLSGHADELGTWSLAVCFWVVWLVVFSVRWPRSMARRAAKTFAQQKSLQLPYDIEIKDTELTTRSADRGEWKVPWADFHKWKADQNLVLVYPSDRLYHMCPRRWFPSDDDYFGFQDLLKRTIGPAGKARKRT